MAVQAQTKQNPTNSRIRPQNLAKKWHFSPNSAKKNLCIWKHIVRICYTGVDQITTKGAGGSTHCQDNMLPRRECFLRIERALHRFCHKPSEGLARSVVLSHHSRV